MKRKRIYLIGHTIEKLCDRKLPTARQILRRFFHKHTASNLTIKQCATSVIKEVEDIWKMCEIPTIQTHNSVVKLLKLHTTWTNLKKSQHRKKNKSQKIKESNFMKKIDKLFEIIPQNKRELLKSKQRSFLVDQGQDRRNVVLKKQQPEETSMEVEFVKMGKCFFI